MAFTYVDYMLLIQKPDKLWGVFKSDVKGVKY